MTCASKSSTTSGQSLLELALLLPVLLLLIIGALDYGLAFYAKVVLENSAREGAYRMVYPDPGLTLNQRIAAAKTAAATEAKDALGNSLVDPATDVGVQCFVGGALNIACPSGSTVVVTVQHPIALMFDIFRRGPLQLSNQAKMLMP